jgi:hypothetical protein
MPRASAPALAGGGIDPARLIGDTPERFARRDVQGEAGDFGVMGDGWDELALDAAKARGAQRLGNLQSGLHLVGCSSGMAIPAFIGMRIHMRTSWPTST